MCVVTAISLAHRSVNGRFNACHAQSTTQTLEGPTQQSVQSWQPLPPHRRAPNGEAHDLKRERAFEERAALLQLFRVVRLEQSDEISPMQRQHLAIAKNVRHHNLNSSNKNARPCSCGHVRRCMRRCVRVRREGESGGGGGSCSISAGSSGMSSPNCKLPTMRGRHGLSRTGLPRVSARHCPLKTN